MALSKTDVFTAADRLVAAGKTPTLNEVRKAVGGGSFTTISDAMKEWREKQQQAAVVPAIREAAPDEIAARLVELGAEVWSLARDKANARLQSEREALEQTRQRLEEEAAEAGELADSLAAELEAAKKSIEDLKAEVVHLVSVADKAKDAAMQAESRAIVAEQLLEGLKEQLEEEKRARVAAESRAGTVELLEEMLKKFSPQSPKRPQRP